MLRLQNGGFDRALNAQFGCSDLENWEIITVSIARRGRRWPLVSILLVVCMSIPAVFAAPSGATEVSARPESNRSERIEQRMENVRNEIQSLGEELATVQASLDRVADMLEDASSKAERRDVRQQRRTLLREERTLNRTIDRKSERLLKLDETSALIGFKGERVIAGAQLEELADASSSERVGDFLDRSARSGEFVDVREVRELSAPDGTTVVGHEDVEVLSISTSLEIKNADGHPDETADAILESNVSADLAVEFDELALSLPVGPGSAVWREDRLSRCVEVHAVGSDDMVVTCNVSSFKDGSANGNGRKPYNRRDDDGSRTRDFYVLNSWATAIPDREPIFDHYVRSLELQAVATSVTRARDIQITRWEPTEHTCRSSVTVTSPYLEFPFYCLSGSDISFTNGRTGFVVEHDCVFTCGPGQSKSIELMIQYDLKQERTYPSFAHVLRARFGQSFNFDEWDAVNAWVR